MTVNSRMVLTGMSGQFGAHDGAGPDGVWLSRSPIHRGIGWASHSSSGDTTMAAKKKASKKKATKKKAAKKKK